MTGGVGGEEGFWITKPGDSEVGGTCFWWLVGGGISLDSELLNYPLRRTVQANKGIMLCAIFRKEMMMQTLPFSRSVLWMVLLVAMLSVTCLAQAPVPEPVSDQETELGQAAYKHLRDQAEIIQSSPLYDSLKPVAERIAGVAQSRYPHPFKFFLVHEAQPNAFATPGGNVYVVDSLLYFAKNTEQLAGTLCHEVSHTIHRDGVTLMEKEKKIEEREVAAAILLGPTRASIIAIALIGKLHSLGYSRDAESKADVTGSDICAEAGYNPWGLIWLFQDFQNADVRRIPQLLSDHPANTTRIQTLENHFRDNPSTFSKFSRDPKSATAFSVPKDAPEVFLRVDNKGGK